MEFSRRENHGSKANETKPEEPEDGVGERSLVFRRAEAHLGALLAPPAATLARRRRGGRRGHGRGGGRSPWLGYAPDWEGGPASRQREGRGHVPLRRHPVDDRSRLRPMYSQTCLRTGAGACFEVGRSWSALSEEGAHGEDRFCARRVRSFQRRSSAGSRCDHEPKRTTHQCLVRPQFGRKSRRRARGSLKDTL